MTFLSHVRLFETPWTVAYQAPPSMGFSRQGYWSGVSFPSPRDLSDPEIEQQSPVLQTDALLSEPKENNRVRKTRDLFKKTRDTKRIFHANMGTIKGRNGMDLKEAEDIKKRWQEYIEELYKKDLHDLDNPNGVITHLEPDILE